MVEHSYSEPDFYTKAEVRAMQGACVHKVAAERRKVWEEAAELAETMVHLEGTSEQAARPLLRLHRQFMDRADRASAGEG